MVEASTVKSPKKTPLIKSPTKKKSKFKRIGWQKPKPTELETDYAIEHLEPV